MKKLQFFTSIKFLLIAFVFTFSSITSIKAQITTTLSTNTTNWQCREQSGYNLNPLSFQDANSNNFSWSTPLQGINWPQSCQNPPMDPSQFPGGQPITVPNRMNCKSDGGYTSFYRSNFTLPNGNSTCEAYIDVRADNYFRLYINGVLVPSSYTNFPGHSLGLCGGFTVANNVTGNGWVDLVRVNITDFLNLGALNQSILFEVGNCDYFNYLSAHLVVNQSIVPGPDPTINFTLNNLNDLQMWGTSNGWSNQTWNLEQSDSPNGPWTFFSSNTNNRPGSIYAVKIPRCVYIRITHTVWYMCGTDIIYARASHVLYSCGGAMSGKQVGSIVENGSTDSRDEIERITNIDHEITPATITTFFDPSARIVKLKIEGPSQSILNVRAMLTSVDGKVVRLIKDQSLVDVGVLEIDAVDLLPGMYFVTVNSNGINETKKVLVTE